MANEVITLTTEELDQHLQAAIQAALKASENDAKSAIKSKAVDFAKDAIKDNASEGLYETYKDFLQECIIKRGKELVMGLVGLLADFLVKNPLLVVLIVVLACIAILFVSIRKYHKRMQARKGLARRVRSTKHGVTEGLVSIG